MPRSAPAHSFETPEECFFEAQRRIAEARSTSATGLDLGGLRHLQQLPADLVDLQKALKRLYLQKTEVIDISALAELLRAGSPRSGDSPEPLFWRKLEISPLYRSVSI